MEENNTILTQTTGSIGIITLNRPEEMNAVNLEMLNEIAYQVQTWEYDDAIKCIIINGNDTVFAAGIDVKASTANLIGKNACSLSMV
jgi:enoyl-CoA hydratase